MSPTWAREGSKRWRYYVSQAALQGDKSKAASILRVPAADVEELVVEAVGKLSFSDASLANIRDLIDRVVVGHATIRIHLSEVVEENDGARILILPWTRLSPYRKREIIQGANDGKTYARPMPANARAILIEALRDAHRWLGELLSDSRLTLEVLASREGRTRLRCELSRGRDSRYMDLGWIGRGGANGSGRRLQGAAIYGQRARGCGGRRRHRGRVSGERGLRIRGPSSPRD
jgi:hypothetical protein